MRANLRAYATHKKAIMDAFKAWARFHTEHLDRNGDQETPHALEAFLEAPADYIKAQLLQNTHDLAEAVLENNEPWRDCEEENQRRLIEVLEAIAKPAPVLDASRVLDSIRQALDDCTDQANYYQERGDDTSALYNRGRVDALAETLDYLKEVLIQ